MTDIVKRLRAKPPKGFVKAPLMIEAADEIDRLRLALHTISFVEADVIVPERMWSEMTPLDCYEEGLINGAMAVRDAVKTEAYAVLALGRKE